MRNVIYMLIIGVSLFCCINNKGTKVKDSNSTDKNEIANIKSDYIIIAPPPIEKIDENTLVGFSCYSTGIQSKSVKEVSEILNDKGIDELKKLLFSNKSACKFLATYICMKQKEKKEWVFTQNEIKQIELNKLSNERINFCSGCNNSDSYSLKELFLTKNDYSQEFEKWFAKWHK
jgi:hypothetical protein